MKIFSLFFLLVLCFSCTKKESDKKYHVIGTGGVTGIYYPAGGAIATVLNKYLNMSSLKFVAESTGGSIFNITEIMNSEIDFGLAQADSVYAARNGLAEWASKGKQTNLRSIFSLHSETLTLVVADDSNIKECKDLKGKRISLGDPESGTRINAVDALSSCNLSPADLKIEELKASQYAEMLQKRMIDGFFYTVGHPSGSLREAIAGKRKIRFIEFPNIESLLSKFPYYSESIIDITQYPGIVNTKNVKTFGMKSLFITSANTNDALVYAITKTIFEHFEELRSLHPALSSLKLEDLFKASIIETHPGALKFYKEAGF